MAEGHPEGIAGVVRQAVDQMRQVQELGLVDSLNDLLATESIRPGEPADDGE